MNKDLIIIHIFRPLNSFYAKKGPFRIFTKKYNFYGLQFPQ
jgi:hypothetical protein